VVERGARASGYATALGFFGHAVGETTDDVKALIATAPSFQVSASSCPNARASCFAGA
jgi:hypothetical protein